MSKNNLKNTSKPDSTAPIDCIIFDMDGTIIDTEPAACAAVKNFFSGCGMTYQVEDLEYVTGRTWESAFEFLFSRYKFPFSKDEVRSKINQGYREALEEHLLIVPGSVEAIKSLSKKYPLALVSGSYRGDILWAMRKLGIESCFQVILGCEDYERSKPKPDGFNRALEILKKAPEKCLIFEDSNAGIESARSAGAWVAAITSTNHFKQDQSKAHFHIVDLLEVNPEWVLKLNLK